MLFVGRGDGRLAAASVGQRGQCLEHPIDEAKSRSLKSHLGEASDIAEAAVFRLGAVLEEFNLDCYAARCRMRNLGGEQAIVRTDCRADDPQNVSFPPFVTPDEPHFRRRVGLDLLEFPLWKIDHHKSARAVRQIENGLSFCDGRAWAGQ